VRCDGNGEADLEPTDEQLAKVAGTGDRDAFTLLIKRYEAAIIALIRASISDPNAVDDIFQETVWQMWKGIGALREPGKLKFWLYQIARNRCRDYGRRLGRDVSIPSLHLEQLVNRFGPRAPVGRGKLDDIDDALAELPAVERDVVIAHYFRGQSVRVVSEKIGVPIGTVKRRLHVARRRMRDILDRGGRIE